MIRQRALPFIVAISAFVATDRGDSMRRKILEVVRERPGIHLGGLMAQTGMGWGSLYHHLARLSHDKLLRLEVFGRRRLVFPVDCPRTEGDAAGHALLSGRTAHAIARLIIECPGLNVSQVAQRSGESPRSVYYHLKRLIDAGLIASASSTRLVGLTAAPSLVDLIPEANRPTVQDAPVVRSSWRWR